MLNYAMRPVLNPLTLLLTVLGFIFFWPLGLLMLAYLLWGGRFHAMQEHFAGMRSDWAARGWDCGPGWSRGGGGAGAPRGFSRSGNAAFDDYRAKELKRLEEERRKLDEELRDFESYMNDLRRARDAEEFDRFMRDRSSRPRNGNTSGGQSTPGGPTIDL